MYVRNVDAYIANASTVNIVRVYTDLKVGSHLTMHRTIGLTD